MNTFLVSLYKEKHFCAVAKNRESTASRIDRPNLGKD